MKPLSSIFPEYGRSVFRNKDERVRFLVVAENLVKSDAVGSLRKLQGKWYFTTKLGLFYVGSAEKVGSVFHNVRYFGRLSLYQLRF